MRRIAVLAVLLLSACSPDEGDTQGGSFTLTVSNLTDDAFAGSRLGTRVGDEIHFTGEHAGHPDDGAGFVLHRGDGQYEMSTGLGSGEGGDETLAITVAIDGYDGDGSYPAHVIVSWWGDGMSIPVGPLIDRADCTAIIGDVVLDGTSSCDGLRVEWQGHDTPFR